MQLQIIYWRDMPAQCVLRIGRKRLGVPLPQRFEQAIDRCAMRANLKGSDAYLEQWRRAPAQEWHEGDTEEQAMEQVRAMIEAQYPNERLQRLIEQQGFETTAPQPPQQEETQTP